MRISPSQVARVDPVAFVPAILALAMWAMILMMVVVAHFEGGPLDELPEATAFVAGMSLLALCVCHLRARRIEEALDTGERVPGRVERQLEYQFWATLWIRYERHGEETVCKLLRVASKRTRALAEGDPVTLVHSPARRSPVVLELFD